MPFKTESEKKRIAIVLGSHRSGTSLLAAGLETLGAELGSRRITASNENPKGFFENEDILIFNDRLLNFLEGRWDNPLFDGQRAIDSKTTTELSPWLDEGMEIINSNFGKQSFVAIKDPRICQLLPFWVKLLYSCGYNKEDVYYIHIARHPMEVAKSQLKRRQENPSFYCLGENLLETVALWLSLSYQALRDTISDKNIILLYNELLYDPRGQLKRLMEFLDIECEANRIDNFCTSFVEESLKRNIAGPDEDSILLKKFPEALDFFNEQKTLSLMNSFSRSDAQKALSILNRFETRSNQLESIVSLISRLSCERFELTKIKQKQERERKELDIELENIRVKYSELMNKLDQAKLNYNNELSRIQIEHNQEREKLRLEISRYQEEIFLIKDTLSWKITIPLRWVRKVQIESISTMKDMWLKERFYARKFNLWLKKKAPFLSRIIYNLLKPLFIVLDKTFEYPGYHLYEMNNCNSTLVKKDIYAEYQQKILDISRLPLVSVIVPNYNHEIYLRQRLDSIYNQTYKNIEVILLDDCSNDNSREILEEYRAKYPKLTRICCNKRNSGGVFYQWEMGLSLASGELIWIAESDDWCSNNFIEELVEFFKDEAVMLAFCRTVFMDKKGEKQIWSTEQYLSDIESKLWTTSFVKTAYDIVRSAWAIKNIIANVSSAIFRNPGCMELIKKEEWKSMRICGDWLFYLHIIRGGLVVYSTQTTNYYRIHSNNTSIATYTKDSYYLEHEIVAKYVNRLYNVPAQVFKSQKKIIKEHWLQTRNKFSDGDLKRCYNIENINYAKKERKPNLLIVSYAFAAGGGETLPIQLANMMKKLGYGVTFMTCDQEPREEGVRGMLRSDIPVISNFFLIKKIVADFGIEVIHSHNAWVDNTIIDMLPEKNKCQLVISMHGMYEMIDNNDLKWMLPRLVKRIDKIVYTAEKNLLPFKKLGLNNNDKFVKIGNALEALPIIPVDLSSIGIGNDAFVLCLVSRAIPEKGWKEAVESVKFARELSKKNIHLILIGEGEDYELLMKNGFPDYVHLLGFKKNIRDYYAASDMGFLPSRFKGESFPLTIIDCLFSGRPVLASNIGEIPFMIEVEGKQAGCLFSLNDWKIPVHEVAKIIARCATDKIYYNFLKDNVHVAAEQFSFSEMCQKYDKIYMDFTKFEKR